MAGEVKLFKEMVEQIVSGDGISGAATLAAGTSPATKSAVLEHARIIADSPSPPTPAHVKNAAQKIVNLLQQPPSAIKAAAKNNTKLYLLGGAGLVAAWFFFIRKK